MNFSNTSFQKLRRTVRFYFRLKLYSAQIKRLFDFILLKVYVNMRQCQNALSGNINVSADEPSGKLVLET